MMDPSIGGGSWGGACDWGGPTLAFGLPGGQEWLILLVLGLLIFGRRLPEVGRSLGRGIVEFKKGIRGIEDDIEESSSAPASLPGSAPPRALSEPTRAEPTRAETTRAEPPPVRRADVGEEPANPYAPEETPAKDE